MTQKIFFPGKIHRFHDETVCFSASYGFFLPIMTALCFT
ncbi:hypothetical protein GMO_19900 [Gluconobacter morbifer G707]|uniref:Uncharacterized protein n=1 Tax=Gluconobacter morbifer G707 TaxID=1088869 RepID=G6XKH4_9PROT|nr:hypothetical protein GMO_19900 [Gluconobacter morbifer G707]